MRRTDFTVGLIVSGFDCVGLCRSTDAIRSLGYKFLPIDVVGLVLESIPAPTYDVLADAPTFDVDGATRAIMIAVTGGNDIVRFKCRSDEATDITRQLKRVFPHVSGIYQEMDGYGILSCAVSGRRKLAVPRIGQCAIFTHGVIKMVVQYLMRKPCTLEEFESQSGQDVDIISASFDAKEYEALCSAFGTASSECFRVPLYPNDEHPYDSASLIVERNDESKTLTARIQRPIVHYLVRNPDGSRAWVA